jgi:nucleotide-binding universal stress UspA family protein
LPAPITVFGVPLKAQKLLSTEMRRESMTSRILAGYDGTPESRSAACFAARLAFAQRAKLVLATVLPRPWPWSPLSEQRDAWQAINENERSRAEAALRAQSLELLDAETLLVYGTPAETLALIAAEPGVILVVVGHRDRSAVARTFRNSVAISLVEICPKPVLVFREPRSAHIATGDGHAASIHRLLLSRPKISGG